MQYEDENGMNEPSCQCLLKGIDALALTGSCPVAHVQEAQSVPDTLSSDTRNEKQPPYGRYQAGILTPQQAAMMLVASDVLASDKTDLERLFRSLTQRFVFLTRGGMAPETPNPCLPPFDSGILGGYITPDNFTITLLVGHSLFDEHFGLALQMPKKLQKTTRFPNNSLDTALCHGNVLLQIYANIQDAVIHTLHDIIKRTPDLFSAYWEREGFISNHAARSKGKEMPIDLLGLKDDIANPDNQNDELMQKVVWVAANQQEPVRIIGGNYQAVRLIQFRTEFWDRTPLKGQQTVFDCDKQTGVPLNMLHEHDVPDYTSDSEGKATTLDSHIRLVNPRAVGSGSSLMLRRGYSHSLGVTNSGQLDMGLLLVYYQHGPKEDFLTVQKELNGEALEGYVEPIGGGYFSMLPGVRGANNYLGGALLWV